jgi:hypothetical protein
VRYVPDAVSAGQAATRWGDATGQRLRWYAGVFGLQRAHLGPLLSSAWRDRNLDALDAALELSLPPFSTLALLSVGLVLAQVILTSNHFSPLLIVSGLLLIGSFLFPILGLLAERAPWHTFRSLLFGPAYALWRVWLGLTVRMRNGNVPWIRTRRAEEESTLT